MSARHVDIARQNGPLGSMYVRIDLNDVRAANTIIVHYDFDRDGWAIDSPTKMQWTPDEDSFDERLEEVAFVPAWTAAAEAELARINGR